MATCTCETYGSGACWACAPTKVERIPWRMRGRDDEMMRPNTRGTWITAVKDQRFAPDDGAWFGWGDVPAEPVHLEGDRVTVLPMVGPHSPWSPPRAADDVSDEGATVPALHSGTVLEVGTGWRRVQVGKVYGIVRRSKWERVRHPGRTKGWAGV